MNILELFQSSRNPDDVAVDDNGRPYIAWKKPDGEWFIITLHEDGTYSVT